MSSHVQTKFFVLSDTQGHQLASDATPEDSFDVVIHCGDLTFRSYISEFRQTLKLLNKLKAPLKLIIAGNHDFSLDPVALEKQIEEANLKRGHEPEDDYVEKSFGREGEARQLLEDAAASGVKFLDEGTHHFTLENGAALCVFASPYTPSTMEWGFSYNGRHDFDIPVQADVVITHGPPHGIMDVASGLKHLGCPQLFASVAKARPRMHCFGHIHGGWGARLVTWRKKLLSDVPSYFTEVDNEKSTVIENVESRLRESRLNMHNVTKRRLQRQKCRVADYSSVGENPLGPNQTLFVNASIAGVGEFPQPPWAVTIDLPRSEGDGNDPRDMEIAAEERKSHATEDDEGDMEIAAEERKSHATEDDKEDSEVTGEKRKRHATEDDKGEVERTKTN